MPVHSLSTQLPRLPRPRVRNCWWIFLVFSSSIAFSQVSTLYEAPGYIIAGHATKGSIPANASFDVTLSSGGNRTIRSTFQLIDESGNPLYIETPALPQFKTETVSVEGTHAFIANKPLALSVDVLIVPDQRLDPSKTYRVKLLSVWDVTSVPTDLGISLIEAPGHTYIHFHEGTGVVSRMASATVSQKFRIQTGIGNAAAFRILPLVDIYRYDPGAAALAPALELSCAMTDHLGNPVPLAQSVFPVARSAGVGGGVAGTPVAAPNSFISGNYLNLQPAEQLDSVNETYTVSVSLNYYQTGVNDSPLLTTAHGFETGPDQLLDFNGSLRFGSIQASFSGITNQPSAGATVASRVSTLLAVSAGNGRITGQTDQHTFGSGAALSVGLDAAGTAHFSGAGTVALSGPATDTAVKEGISFERDGITLSTAGMSAASLTVTLPPGLGYTATDATMVLESTCPAANVALAQDLSPLNASVALAVAAGYLHEESKPLRYEINGLTWSTASGSLQAAVTGVTSLNRSAVDSLAALAGKMVNPEAAVKASNNFVCNGASGVPSGTLQITVDANGNGAVSTGIALAASSFYPHFPYAQPTNVARALHYAGGTMTLQQDQCAAGSSLTGVPAFVVDYNRACNAQPDGTPCGAEPDFATVSLLPTAQTLYFTPDGGLQGTANAGAHQLKWGRDPVANPAQYTHTVITSFNAAGYLMAGSWLAGGLAGTGATAPDLDTWMGAGAILLSGEDPGQAGVVRPHTEAYQETDNVIADYPGVTFRVLPGGKNAKSRLAGVETPVYPLADRGQYYVRYAGVSGIHQADVFVQPLQLYGYDVKLSTLQFSYLDNANHGSRTEGHLDLPSPSGFTAEFSQLKISCPGGLLDAEVANDPPNVELVYWKKAPLELLSMRFETLNACDVTTPACLVFGVQARAELFPQKLCGEMGFRPNGQIATRTNALNGAPPFDSRLKVPAVKLPGPGSKSYTFTPSQDAYFNDQASAGAPATPNGYLNLFGTVDVPFFQDLKWHVQTYGKYTEGLPPTLYRVASGWTENGATGFSQAFFDENNRGFHGAGATAYFQSSADGGDYAVAAQQDWLGIDNAFHYKLMWNEGGKAFSSADVSKNFFVFNLTHRAKYLSPDTAEVTFGASYDGLPQINLGGLAASALDEAVGYTGNLTDALGGAAADTLLEGLTGGKSLLCSDAQDLLAPVVDGPVMAEIDGLIAALYALPGAGGSGAGLAAVLQALQDRIEAPGSPFQTALNSAFNTTADGSMTHHAGNQIQAIRSSLNVLTADGTGLLQLGGVQSLIRSLVADYAPEFIGVVAEALDDGLDDYVSVAGLAEVRASLAQVNARLDTIRTRVTDGSNGLAKQIQGTLTPELREELGGEIAYAIEEELRRRSRGTVVELAELPQARLREIIRQTVLDTLAGSALGSLIQEQLREYAQDAVAAATTGFDSGLQQVNSVLRDVIATHLAAVDQSIGQKVLGPMQDMIGAGRLTGYAHINGDSLTELRVDGKFRWKIPDDLDLKAYLLIKQLDSDNRGGCIDEGEIANEITIGAEGVPLEWISPGLDATLGVKFTLLDGSPIGVGGFFDMTGGPLTFEVFKINDINAALAFGAKDGDPLKAENYLAGSGGISIGEYDLSGGLFFGRTCSLDPILLIDAEVASVLGSPPFTGAYVYGEAHLPVNELLGIPSSCMLLLKYGLGAGAFVFAEGPTFGGKFTGEISGEALCLLSISGRMSLVGVKQGLTLDSPMRFKGTGTLKGKAGSCPFCVRFRESVSVTFEVRAGDISSPSIDY